MCGLILEKLILKIWEAQSYACVNYTVKNLKIKSFKMNRQNKKSVFNVESTMQILNCNQLFTKAKIQLSK